MARLVRLGFLLRILVALCLVGPVAGLRAQAPAGYYAAAQGLTGTALKAKLHEIISVQTVIPYSELIVPLRAIWEDPQNSSRMRLIYGGTSVAKTDSSWNREHLWPRSRGVNPGSQVEGGPDDSDLFHVVPADANVNSSRGTKYFDVSSAADGSLANPAHPEAPQCTSDANSWQPPVAERGDIARALFYMAVRYDGQEPGTADLELVTLEPTDSRMANLAILLQWHAQDPPDADELARQERIYAIQGNRNPFIDHPQWASDVWGVLNGSPTAQITGNTVTVVESTGAMASLAVTLNMPAPAGGLVVRYAVTGTAAAGDYTLAGAGVNAVAQTISIDAGVRSVKFTLAANADGIVEPAETLQFTLLSDPAYAPIGGPVNVTIYDEPPVLRGTVAAWRFDAPPFSKSAPILADLGTGTVDTAGWGGNVKDFTGISGASLALEQGSGGSGTFIEVHFSAAGWTNLRLSFQTRSNPAGGFTSGSWSWSTDGVSFTPVSAPSTHATSDQFTLKTLDLSAIAALQNAPSVRLRYRLSASGSIDVSANNRIDDLAITGFRYSSAWLARFPGFSGPNADPMRDPDGDGLPNLGEWALDKDPLTSTAANHVTLGRVVAPDPANGNANENWVSVQFHRRTDTAQLTVVPEESSDLKTWTTAPIQVQVTAGPRVNTETVTYRGSIPLRAAPQYFRLRFIEP